MPRTKKRRGRRARGGAGLATLSLSDLQKELQRRQSAVRPLQKKRDRLAAKLAVLDRQLGALGVSAGPVAPTGRMAVPGRPGTGKRFRNEMSLVEALQKVLTGKTMSVSTAADAVRATGYRTTSPNFRVMVNQALLTKRDLFKKVSRGQYTSK